MKRLTLQLTFFVVIVTCIMSCSGSWQDVFEGTPEEVRKIQAVIRGAGVSTRLRGTADKQTILILEKDARRLATSLQRLKSLLALTCRPGSSLEEYFLPVNTIDNVVRSKSFSQFLMSLHSMEGVFTVTCTVRPDVERLDGKIITVWHEFSGETGVKQLKANVITNAETAGLSLGEHIKFRRIPWENANEYERSDEPESNLNLIIFEPFSFRVLNSEKSIAGIQFLVMLVLFLISGFTLGYWWGKR